MQSLALTSLALIIHLKTFQVRSDYPNNEKE